MRRTRSFRINRRLLVAAAIIYTFIITFFLVFNLDEQNWIRIRHDYVCLIMIIAFILPVPLFFAALRFPAMIYSKIVVGICTFWLVFSVLLMPFFLVGVFDLFSVVESSSVLTLVLTAYSVFGLICAAKSVVEAVAWVSELREKKKAEDAEKGIEQMTSGLITFLRPRLTYALMLFGILLMINMMSMQDSVADVADFIIFIIFFRGALLLTAAYILWSIWDYHRYIKSLEHSGVLNQAVLEYYSGHAYCEGHVVLGVKYIFVEGEARIYEYENFTKYFFKWDDSGRVHVWYLYAVKKDGTEIPLIELPYYRTKKNYYEHVYPMINEIRIKSKNVSIEGPGEFRK